MAAGEVDFGVCVPGFKANGVRGSRYGVAVIFADVCCETAYVQTRNAVKAAPLGITRASVKGGLQAIVANSGCANCMAGGDVEAANAMACSAAVELCISSRDVGVASTGVIGVPLEVKDVDALIKEACGGLECSASASMRAAKAIMTTDKVPKSASANAGDAVVGGICKGSGMIEPNMGTMLAFLTTDAALPKGRLQAIYEDAVEASFNHVSVDASQSTNDMALLLSNRRVKCGVREFKDALDDVCVTLAKMIAADGEGATKLVEFVVEGASSKKQAEKAVRAMANSPLLKSAIGGENPNWGRVLSAVGSVTKFDPLEAEVAYESELGSAIVWGERKGGDAATVMKARELTVVCRLNRGKDSARVWGCDLSEEYVKINAEYN